MFLFKNATSVMRSNKNCHWILIHIVCQQALFKLSGSATIVLLAAFAHAAVRLPGTASGTGTDHDDVTYYDGVESTAATGVATTTSTANLLDVDVESTATGVTTTTANVLDVDSSIQTTAVLLDAQISQLKEKIALLQKQNKNLLKQIRRMNGSENNVGNVEGQDENGNDKDDGAISDNASFILQVLEAIKGVIGWKRYRRWGKKRIGILVAKVVFDQATFLPHLLRLARKHFRENVFTAFNIIREMDLAGGTLNYEGIEILRRVETNGVKGFRGSMIPSKSEVKRMAGVVEWYAQEQFPFRLQQTIKGESIQFDYAKAMLCVAKAFHLDIIGKSRSLSVASSIDGASLSKNLSIIAGGIKVIDRGARCPVTNRPLLDNPCTMSAQSRNLCIILKLMMGRETKETFADFGSMFKFLDSLSDAASMPVELEGFLPFSCMTNCDLSAQWKGLRKGGAAKVHTLPCTGCATESDLLATPNARPCARWCTEHSAADPEWMCYHKPMASPERVATMQAEVALLVSTLERALVEIDEESRITRFDAELDDPPEACFKDNMSVHYSPDTANQKQSYSRLLTNELILRGHDIDGNLNARRERL